jgi:hypothetical protein
MEIFRWTRFALAWLANRLRDVALHEPGVWISEPEAPAPFLWRLLEQLALLLHCFSFVEPFPGSRTLE